MNRKRLFKLGISVITLSLILLVPSISFAVSNLQSESINLVSKANDILLSSNSRSLQSTENSKIQISKERMDAMISIAKTNPNLFLSKVISPTEKALLSKSLQNNIESEATIEGTFGIVVSDNFKTKEEKIQYKIISGNKTYDYYPSGTLDVKSGDKVRVKGYSLSNIFVSRANDIKIIRGARLASNGIPDSVGVQRMLVFLLKPKADSVQNITIDQARNFVFNGQFNKFMTEQSNGKVSFIGDVYGWDLISDPNFKIFDENRNCYIPDDLDSLVKKHNIDIRNYDRVLFLYDNNTNHEGCSQVGKLERKINDINHPLSTSIVSVGPYSRFNGTGNNLTDFEFVISHELGHSLGLLHANGLNCKDAVINDTCEEIEYGNSYDAMGMGEISTHFNAYYKYKLGWLNPDQIINANKSGTYEISPQENGSKARLIKIKFSDKDHYFIEMRDPFGFDSNLNNKFLKPNISGIFVNKINNNAVTQLLDMSPDSAGNWFNNIEKVTLNHPNLNNSLKQFTDSNLGITIGPITNVNINNTDSSLSTIKFNISLNNPGCISKLPEVAVNEFHSDGVYDAGTWAGGDISITNLDSSLCNASDFTLKYIDAPAGWTQKIYPSQISLDGGETDSFIYQLKIPENTISNDYSIKMELKNINTGWTKVVDKTIYVNGVSNEINYLPWTAPSSVRMASSFNVLLNFTGGPSDYPQAIALNFYDKDSVLKFSKSVNPTKLSTTWSGNTTIPAVIDISGDVPSGVYRVGLNMYSVQESKRALQSIQYDKLIGQIEIVEDSTKIPDFKTNYSIITTPEINTSVPQSPVSSVSTISILPWIGPESLQLDTRLNYIITFRGGPTKQDQRIFVHFIDQAGNIKFLSDIHPDVPTTKWSGIVRIPISLSVPNNIPVGNYKVVAGLYSGSSSVTLTPAGGVIPYGNNTNRYQVGTLSILKSASSPALASPANVVEAVKSIETKKVETRDNTSSTVISTPTTYSSPTRRNYRSSSSSSSPSPSSTPAPTPSASPVSTPAPVSESHGSSPTTTASPVTSVPCAPTSPAPAPVSEPAPAPVVSAPSPSSSPTPAPSPSPVSESN